MGKTVKEQEEYKGETGFKLKVKIIKKRMGDIHRGTIGFE